MAIQGVFSSDKAISGDPKTDFAAGLLKINPAGSAPMLALTSGMRSSDIKSLMHTWFEESHESFRVLVTNNAGVDVTFVVSTTDASTIVPGSIYMSEDSGEYVMVESVSGTTVTVQRGLTTAITTFDGSSTPVAWQKITNAHEEGSTLPTAMVNIGSPRFNLMQTIRDSWDVTGSAAAIHYNTTSDIVAKSKSDAAMFHAENIERALMWGRQAFGVRNNKPFRLMDGFLTQIQTNITTQGSNTTKANLDTFLQGIFDRNIKGKPNERIAFCGNTVLRIINEIAALNSQHEMTSTTTEFGMKVRKWITPFGDISLMTHPLMNESPLWTKDLHVLHPAALETIYLRRTKHDAYDKTGQTAGRDAKFGVFTTEITCKLGAEITCGSFTGIDTAAA